MADERVDVKFGADTGNLESGTETAATAVDSSTARIGLDFERMQAQTVAAVTGMKAQIESSFAQMKTAMHSITGAMAGIGLALAGGAAFKEVIGETNAWTGEALKLSRQLGVTTESASALMVAAHAVGLTNEQVEGTVKGFVRSLKTNEEGLNKMGIATLDAQGHTRNMMDVMLDANKVLLGYKEGKDRDVASMAVYGRAALDNSLFLKLNAAAMEEAKRKQEELGIEVGPKAVAQFKAYRLAMVDIKEVFEAVKIQIGNAVMPVFIALGSWFGSVGPGLVEIFAGAIKGITSLIMFLGLGVQTAFQIIKGEVMVMVNTAIAGYNALSQAAHGDFSGAAKTVGDAWHENGKIVGDSLDKITASANKTNEALGKMWGLTPSKQSKLDPDAGGKQYDGDAKVGKDKGAAEKSRLSEFEHDLEQQKEKKAEYFKDSRQSDLAYWQGLKENANLNSKELEAVDHKIYEIKKSLAQEALQVQLEHMKTESNEALKGSQTRIDIAVKEAALIKNTYGVGSKEYASAQEHINQMTREHTAEVAKEANKVLEHQIKMLSESVKIEQEALKQKFTMGQISREEEYQGQVALLNKEFELTQKYKKEEAANLKDDVQAKRDILNQIELLQKQHVQSMQKINGQMALDEKKQWSSMFDAISKSFGTAVTGMITGATKFQKAMQQMCKQVLTSFVQSSMKMLSTHLSNTMAQIAGTQAGESAKGAAEKEGSLQSMATSMMTTLKKINNSALAAAAGAYDAMASIPYVGPVLGAIAAAVTYTGVMAFGAMASASGGYDIPAGTNPVTQLHSKEMVLPADLAENVRNMTGKGQQGQGGDTHNHNWHVSAVDAKGVKQFFKQHGSTLANQINSCVRNGSPIGPR